MPRRPVRSLEEREKLRRKHCIQLTLNDFELEALSQYCIRRRASSRTTLLREIIMSEVIRSWERESPKLFSEDEMR